MTDLDIGSETFRSYELVLVVRDPKGNPTGRTKSIKTDDANELAAFWDSYQITPKKKKKKKKKKNKEEKLPGGKEAEAILKDMYNDNDVNKG